MRPLLATMAAIMAIRLVKIKWLHFAMRPLLATMAAIMAIRLVKIKWLHLAMRPLLATMAAIMAIRLVGGVLRLAMRVATSATHCDTTVTEVAGIILCPLFTKDSSGNQLTDPGTLGQGGLL